GSYTVTLTVKDNQNASSSPVSHTVQVNAPNQPPTAAFTSSCTGLEIGRASCRERVEGSVAGGPLKYGNGSTGSTARYPSHSFTDQSSDPDGSVTIFYFKHKTAYAIST